MPRVVGIDHLVLSVGDFARSKAFYGKLLGFLGFKLKHSYPDMAGWSNGKTLFWIAAGRRARQEAQISQGRYRLPSLRVRAFEPQGCGRARRVSREEQDDDRRSARRVLRATRYYAVYFTDPDGMKLEGMVYKPPPKTKTVRKKK